MTSLHTNSSAISALSTLRSIDSASEKNYAEVSSGLRVSTASNNAAYWSIATTMKSDTVAVSAASDAIGFTAAVFDTAYNGMEAVRDQMSTIRNLLIMASQLPAPELSHIPPYGWVWDEYDPAYQTSQQAKVAQEVDERIQEIRSILQSSSFGGINLLYVGDDSPIDAATVVNSFVTGFTKGKVQTIDIPLTQNLLLNESSKDLATGLDRRDDNDGVLDRFTELQLSTGNVASFPDFVSWIISGTGGETYPAHRTTGLVRNIEWEIKNYGADRQDAWDKMIGIYDGKLLEITQKMTRLGAQQKAVQAYDELVRIQMGTLTKGVGNLIDANMEASAAKQKALQTQKQLGTQALNISNSNADNIMQLYR